MSKPTITARRKIAVLNFAIAAVDTMHGSVTGGGEHAVIPTKCACAYGESIRGLKIMRREAYETIQKAKLAAVKKP